MNFRQIILFLAFTSSFNASAAVYKCKILDGKQLTENGHIESMGRFYGALINSEFIIKRDSGERFSKSGATTNKNANKINVLSKGDNSTAYRVISYYGGNAKMDYIEVNQYNESKEKSFIFYHAMSAIYSGLCEEI